jgi:hypothetical protein
MGPLPLAFGSMRGRAVWTLLSGASVLLVCGLANAQCTKDTDCKGDRVCEAGKCASPQLPPAPPAPPGSDTPGATAPASGAEPAAGADPGQGTPAATPGTAEPAPGNALEPSVNLKVQPASGAAPAGATTPLGQDEPQTRRRSRAAMIAGIAMVSVGPIALLGALAAKNAQEKCDDDLRRDYPDHRLPPSERYRVDQCDEYSAPLYVFGIGGALLSVGGIPLIIYGGKSVPKTSASLRVLPWAGPESTGLKLRLEL